MALVTSSDTSRVAFLNSLMPVPSPLASSRQLLCAKQDQNQGQDEDNLPTAEVKQAKHDIHNCSLTLHLKLFPNPRTVKQEN